MSDVDLSKLKVAELRAELTSRGLDSKGNKAALIERLREFIEAENESAEAEAEKETEDQEEDDPLNDEVEAEQEESVAQEQNGQEQGISEEKIDQEPELAEEPNGEEEETLPLVANEPEDERIKQEEDKPTEPESPKENLKNKPDFEDAPMEDIDVKEEIEDCDKQEIAELEQCINEVKNEECEVKEENIEVKEETQGTEDDGDRRGVKRSQSPAQDDGSKKARPDVEEVRVEDEPEFDKSLVALDWYNSDLSLLIAKKDFLSATPLTIGGFAYIWHGARATYGCNKGKICFEVEIESHLKVDHLEGEEQHPHVIRCGWSVDDSSLTLGEEKLSYGYGGTGKASTNLKFKDYGKTFGKGDVIGCFLDLESEPIVMTYTVNGEHQGICYEIPHSELGDGALFPHILTKNCSYKVNFGDLEQPWQEPLTDYVFMSKVPLEDRIAGMQGPEKREDAEAIMMVGLPASGKTTWVENFCKDNRDKKYNVLGTNNLIDKMKVMGLPRKRNYRGRWDNLIDKCTKCLNKLLYMATKRRRNFIIDQTNVYPSAQKRKIKGFGGCKRRAIVVCPTDEDLKLRTKKRESEEGKEVPDKAILEMKANFKLPEVGEFFDEVEFIELNKEETEKLVEQYNKEGEKAGFGIKKFGRGNHAGRRGNFIDRRGGYNHRGSYRGGWDRDRDRRGSFDRRDRGGWNRDSRDNRDRGNFNRDNRSGSFNRDRGNRGGGNWQGGFKGANQSNLKQTNTWAGSNQNNQGGYSSQGWGNQGYGNQGWNQQQGYNTGYNWNQQYYGQQQQQQQQSYWQGYGNQQTSYNPQTSYSTQTGYAPNNYGYGQQQQTQPQVGQTQQQQQWSGSGYGYSQTGGQYRK